MKCSAIILSMALVATPAAAQGHDHGTMGEAAPAQQGEHCALMMLGGAPLMGTMHAGPHAVLQRGEALGLSAAQRTELEALQGAMHAGVHGHLEAGRTAQGEAAAMVGAAGFDAQAYEAKLRAAADHVVQAQLAATGFTTATRELLTPEQRAQVAEGHGMMSGMNHEGMNHEGMNHEGMGHEGMMQGGMMGMMQRCMSMHGGGH
ncbi:MAG: Spy/CpxP family protein refolding chaperone [Gemmatimonadota bacterium]